MPPSSIDRSLDQSTCLNFRFARGMGSLLGFCKKTSVTKCHPDHPGQNGNCFRSLLLAANLQDNRGGENESREGFYVGRLLRKLRPRLHTLHRSCLLAMKEDVRQWVAGRNKEPRAPPFLLPGLHLARDKYEQRFSMSRRRPFMETVETFRRQ